MPVIDLHAHSKFSDGTTTPSEVVHAYLLRGVQMMSLTDHDTTAGLEQAEKEAQKAGILFVRGVEISAHENDHLHILGYNIDVNNKQLQDLLARNRERRITRIKKIVSQLQEAGVNIQFDDVFKLTKGLISRAHVADALKNNKVVPSRQEGFRKYLVPGKAGYVTNDAEKAADIFAAIKAAGGKSFIAHPGIIKDAWNFPQWVTEGLNGLELYYPSHSFEMKQDLELIAKKYNLMVSGGSDHHGNKSGRDNTPGMEVPQEVFDKLKKMFFGE